VIGRHLEPVLAVGCVLAVATMARAQDQSLVLPRTNQPASITQRIGVTDIAVKYNRPSARGRRVFGALVPYGQVWRTGSDEATTITFSTDVSVNGQPVPAGAYALFTIPTASAWTVVLNRRAIQWGSYSHDPADDVVTVTVAPTTTAEHVEALTIAFDNVTARSALLQIMWERTRVPVTIDVDVVALTVPRIDAAMKGAGRKPYFLAAMFYFEHGLDINQASEWIAAAIAEQPGHIGMLYRQALILEKKGDRAGALAAARASLAGAAQSPKELRDEYTRLNEALIARLTPWPHCRAAHAE
jgi:hypothetical protein